MRQLTDGSGVVTMAQVYQPFGKASATYGTANSSYAFAGEMTDASGMQYLRARYYAPSTGRFISRDVWQGDPLQPMGYNLWLYVYSNPIMYTDPSGEFGVLGSGLIGGVIGAGFSYAKQVVKNVKNDGLNKEAFTNVDVKEVIVGAVSGAIAGATFGLGTVVAGSGLGASIVSGSASGLISGITRRFVSNVLHDRNPIEGVFNPGAMAVDTAIGAASGVLAYGARRIIANILLQRATNSANGQLADDLLNEGRDVLSPAEYAAGQNHPGVGRMMYGKAVERLTASNIRCNPLTRNLFRYVAGPNNPDFVGRGILNGLNFDVTTSTASSIANHLARPYGEGLILSTYVRPENFVVFP